MFQDNDTMILHGCKFFLKKCFQKNNDFVRTNTMRILLIGSGGREQAMAMSLMASPLCTHLWVAPGNTGITCLSGQTAVQVQSVAIAANAIEQLVAFARQEKIDFVISGPEEPLVQGLYDAMKQAGIACLGPSRAAACLEGSKVMMKELVHRFGVPTATYETFHDAATARLFARQLLQTSQQPVVIKTNGLAAGKGVVIAATATEADAAIDAILIEKKFGAAGNEIIIEEFLRGQELSYFILTDGTNSVFLGAAEDHKQAFDHDQGPNTGGMGAYSPSPILTPDLQTQIEKDIVAPTIAGMKSIGCPYQGILFFGLMVDGGRATLLEINIRLGDPEAAVILLNLQTDLLTALLSAEKNILDDFQCKLWPRTALAVVMASRGYPDNPCRGQVIALPDLPPDCYILHAGTKQNADGQIIANGGRVLTIAGTAANLTTAREKIYGVIDRISFPDSFYRRDIGARTNK